MPAQFVPPPAKPRAVRAESLHDGSVREFASIKEAHQAGFTPGLIDAVIRGRRAHHKGYAWSYADLQPEPPLPPGITRITRHYLEG
jgi:hypothetical protein